MGNLFVESH